MLKNGSSCYQMDKINPVKIRDREGARQLGLLNVGPCQISENRNHTSMDQAWKANGSR
ncbi:hypothetical protein HanRHA438_Chr14g0654681 [Helianthus annuus]|nr:hypothetical protein HanRHA438_Chr14g0654681 [Helianthus annuus]